MRETKRKAPAGVGKRRRTARDRITPREYATLQAKAWAFMAAISVSLSDHPVIVARKEYRRLVDQARKALFDLHCAVDKSVRPARLSGPVRRRWISDIQELANDMTSLWQDVGGRNRNVEVIGISEAQRRFRSMFNHSLAGGLFLVRGRPPGMVALISVDDLLHVLSRLGPKPPKIEKSTRERRDVFAEKLLMRKGAIPRGMKLDA